MAGLGRGQCRLGLFELRGFGQRRDQGIPGYLVIGGLGIGQISLSLTDCRFGGRDGFLGRTGEQTIVGCFGHGYGSACRFNFGFVGLDLEQFGLRLRRFQRGQCLFALRLEQRGVEPDDDVPGEDPLPHGQIERQDAPADLGDDGRFIFGDDLARKDGDAVAGQRHAELRIVLCRGLCADRGWGLDGGRRWLGRDHGRRRRRHRCGGGSAETTAGQQQEHDEETRRAAADWQAQSAGMT